VYDKIVTLKEKRWKSKKSLYEFRLERWLRSKISQLYKANWWKRERL